MKVKFEKEKYPSTPEIGWSNAKFYAFCIVDGKRYGTTWRFNDGKYVINQDFDRRIHSRENRPKQIVGNTLAELKSNLYDAIHEI